MPEDDLTQGEVMAIVADRQQPLLFNIGTQVTVLPEEAIPAAAKTGNKVRVNGYDGKAVVRDMANVQIKIGEKVYGMGMWPLLKVQNWMGEVFY